MKLHDKQRDVAISLARNKVIRAGRKGGKTSFEVENICYKATASVERLSLTKEKFASGRKVIYIAPTQKQAREIIWGALKQRLAGIGDPHEQTLQMRVPNEDGEMTTIYVGGWENRENYRGLTDVIHITFDETDTLKDFFAAWQAIFRPLFLDTGGTAHFIGTPQKENPNLRRLEKEYGHDNSWGFFHFTSFDNPYLSRDELEKTKQDYAGNQDAYRQEILAEYVENVGALFHYGALVDVFSNTITKSGERFLIVDVADDGSDKTTLSRWEGLEEYEREEFARMNTENIINKIREVQTEDRIPMSHTVVDAIGVGAGVASSSLLDGIIGYKSSYAPIKTDHSIVRLPGVHYTEEAPLVSEYKNLRSQCVFILADHVNNHKIASRVSGDFKEKIIEELSHYQDASPGDGKRLATMKEDVKAMLGRSPDHSDTWIMRMYFEVRNRLLPDQSEHMSRVIEKQKERMARTRRNAPANSTK